MRTSVLQFNIKKATTINHVGIIVALKNYIQKSAIQTVVGKKRPAFFLALHRIIFLK